MNPAAVHAVTVAIVIVVIAAALFAAAVVAAALLRPEPPGRHRLDGDKTAAHFRSLRETPAPDVLPVQARRPGDPRREVREVRGAATPLSPGGAPVPPEAAPEPHAPARAATPQPHSGLPPSAAQGSPGLGHPFRPVIMQFPGGEVGILGADGRWHIRPLAFDGRSPRETGAQPALVRGSYEAYEAWRDAAVNLP